MKKLRTSVNICQSYHKNKRVSFFYGTQCIQLTLAAYQQIVLALLGYEDKPFVEFLKSKKLTDTVRHYVQHAIAMVTDDASTIEVMLVAPSS